eukprot:51853-Prorocentrum_minimum.AAC.1
MQGEGGLGRGRTWRVSGGRCGEGGEVSASVDACEPQNPANSEEYHRYLQGVLYSTRGAQASKALVTYVVNTQDSQEQASGSLD